MNKKNTPRQRRDSNTTLPVVPEARQKAQQPEARNQGRYRAAIREFLQGEAEGVNLRSRPRLSPQ